MREQRPTQEGFASSLHRHQAKLFGYIHSLVRDMDDADDIFQQTSLVLWKKFEEFDPARSFLAWACGIARLEASNFLRTRGRSRLYFSDELNILLIDSQQEISDEELEGRRNALHGCMARLRQRDRTLIEECYATTSGVSVVALQSGRSPQSVHNSLRRIRRALFECIHRTLVQEMRA